jgi:hypothetical protein
MDNKQILEQIVALEKTLAAMRASIGIGDNQGVVAIGPKSTPEEAVKRSELGLCTCCGKPLPVRYKISGTKWTVDASDRSIERDEDGQLVLARRQSDRGADNACYVNIRREIVQKKSMTDEDAIAWGWYLPRKKNEGRPLKDGTPAHRRRTIEAEIAKTKISKQDVSAAKKEIRRKKR